MLFMIEDELGISTMIIDGKLYRFQHDWFYLEPVRVLL